MPYSFKSRVRYSEVGESGLLTLPGILNYFQDCSTFQSEAVGLGFDVLKERNRFWVLGSWQVIVERYPRFTEEIITSTWAYGFRGFQGLRNFTMDTAEGERIAYANSFWVYLDLETGRPVRLKEEDTAGYGIEEKLDMEYADRKIRLPENMTAEESFAVQKQHLDTNHHVNNCQYVRMAMDFLPADFQIHQMRVEYRNQAHLHDMICPKKAAADGKITVALDDAAGQPYAAAEFEGRKNGGNL